MILRVGQPLRIGLLASLVVSFCALSGCATLRKDFPKHPSQTMAPSVDSATTEYVRSETDAHPGDSGFRVLTGNINALMSRIVLADRAAHSIDLQYYIFRNDPTGRLLARHLLGAADRGVRVRILLDDLGIAKEDHLLDALDAHPNVQVRLFNPFSVRNRALWSKGAQFLFEGRRLNRRMHNKSFTVDNMLTIVGGRNIGDAYFDAGDDVHFRDLDVVAIGPVVGRTSMMFDTYWNSVAAHPVGAFRGARNAPADLDRLRLRLAKDARAFAESEYARAMAEESPRRAGEKGRVEWDWGPATLVSDDPGKVDPGQDGSFPNLIPQIKAMLDDAKQEAVIISPYLIPGRKGTAYLQRLSRRGVAVQLLTNSFQATDEPEVHAAYSRYRRSLLEAGVELHELRPIQGREAEQAFGSSSGVSLHAKAMVVDHAQVFIGSMNFDPRSRLLNTEMGVIVDSPGLAASVERFFGRAVLPENAWRVTLERDPAGSSSSRKRLYWTAVDGNKVVRFDHEPGISWLDRIKLGLLRILPIEGLL